MIAAFGGNAYTLAAAPLLPWWAIATLAAVVMLTDGQVHDVPPGDAAAAAQQLGAPMHALLSGRPDEADRRLVVAQAPSFGLVGKDLPLSIRVEDLPARPKDAQSRPEG